MRWTVGDGGRRSGCVGASLGTGRCAGPRTDESQCMISVRTWVSETMMQVDHSVRALISRTRKVVLINVRVEISLNGLNCRQRIRALRGMWETCENFFFVVSTFAICNEMRYLDKAIEVLRDIESYTVLVSEGTAQVKEVFEQVKVVVRRRRGRRKEKGSGKGVLDLIR